MHKTAQIGKWRIETGPRGFIAPVFSLLHLVLNLPQCGTYGTHAINVCKVRTKEEFRDGHFLDELAKI